MNPTYRRQFALSIILAGLPILLMACLFFGQDSTELVKTNVAGTRVAGQSATQAVAQVTADSIAGTWTGCIRDSNTGGCLADMNISVQKGCTPGRFCGTYSIPAVPCEGNLAFSEKNGETFIFEQQLTRGDVNSCGTGSFQSIKLNPDGTLDQTWTDGTRSTYMTLTRK